MGVSIIICCYNSVLRLPETLTHIAKQKLSEEIKCEVVLVDNNSTDGTAEFAKELWKAMGSTQISLTVVKECSPGLTHARARGISTASFEYLIFCDDDNWLNEKYVETAFLLLKQDPSIGILGGKGLPHPEVSVPSWFSKHSNLYAVGAQHGRDGIIDGKAPAVYGAGAVSRKSILEELFNLGFKPLASDRKGKQLSSGGDIELCFAVKIIGYEIAYSSSLTFEHFIPKERLEYDYIKRLKYQMGYCGGIHMPYKWLFDNENDTYKRSWVWGLLGSSSIFFSRLFALNCLISNFRSEYVLALFQSLGRVKSFCDLNKQIDENFSTIIHSRWYNVSTGKNSCE